MGHIGIFVMCKGQIPLQKLAVSHGCSCAIFVKVLVRLHKILLARHFCTFYGHYSSSHNIPIQATCSHVRISKGMRQSPYAPFTVSNLEDRQCF